MARTHDLVAFDVPAGELAAVVRADVFDRVELAAEVEDDDLRAVHVGDAPLAGASSSTRATVTQSLTAGDV